MLLKRAGLFSRRLHQFHERLVIHNHVFPPLNTSLVCVSSPGSNKAKPKLNQDYFAYSHTSPVICLCDGHGYKGEEVSKIVAETLTADVDPKMAISDEERIQLAQQQIFTKVGPHKSLHCGSSAVWVRDLGDEILISNVGDSRCLVVGEEGEILFETRDHKPDDPIELERIRHRGGTVRQSQGDVPRVSGLALSRAFGDFASAGVVSCEQEATKIKKRRIMYCVLCTDGVTDVMSSEEIALCAIKGDIVALVKLCKIKWSEASKGQFADDVTCAVWKLF